MKTVIGAGQQASVSRRGGRNHLRTCGDAGILRTPRERDLNGDQKDRSRFGKNATGARRTGSSEGKTPVALTLKVDDETYIRVCTLRATQRRTSQEILHQALAEYLDRVGA
jgi:hypothetical protein